MWDLVKEIIGAVMPLAQSIIAPLVSGALAPAPPRIQMPPTSYSFGGTAMPGAGASQPPLGTPGLSGAGQATRPSGMANGAFMGSPPSQQGQPGPEGAPRGTSQGFSSMRPGQPQQPSGFQAI